MQLLRVTLCIVYYTIYSTGNCEDAFVHQHQCIFLMHSMWKNMHIAQHHFDDAENADNAENAENADNADNADDADDHNSSNLRSSSSPCTRPFNIFCQCFSATLVKILHIKVTWITQQCVSYIWRITITLCYACCHVHSTWDMKHTRWAKIWHSLIYWECIVIDNLWVQ